MLGARTILPLSLGLALGAASLPASAQVGIPSGQIHPYGYTPPAGEPPPGYGQAPQTRFVSPVAMGFGIALAVIGVGMTVGGFIAIAQESKSGEGSMMPSALLGVGGTCIAGAIPLLIYGAREVPVYAPNGYGPMMKAPSWLGQPRVIVGSTKNGAPFGATWGWQF